MHSGVRQITNVSSRVLLARATRIPPHATYIDPVLVRPHQGEFNVVSVCRLEKPILQRATKKHTSVVSSNPVPRFVLNIPIPVQRLRQRVKRLLKVGH